jgi:hypothetical protein
MNLLLQGVPVYVSGVAGHCVVSGDCSLRMHWRIGMLRVSTVGGYKHDGRLDQVGSGRWSETMVFRVVDVAGEPEGAIEDGGHSGVSCTCVTGPDTRAAERLHWAIANELAAVHNDSETRLHDDEIDMAVRRAHEWMDANP